MTTAQREQIAAWKEAAARDGERVVGVYRHCRSGIVVLATEYERGQWNSGVKPDGEVVPYFSGPGPQAKGKQWKTTE